MIDHGQCRVEANDEMEHHICPPCPHGLERGGSFALTGNPKIDARQREMKLIAIDRTTCDGKAHAELLGCAPMSLSEQARRLLERQPVDKSGVCIHCEQTPKQDGHAMDCAWWLPHTRILETLALLDTVAERVVWSEDGI